MTVDVATRRDLDDDNISTSPPAAETTPLLVSESAGSPSTNDDFTNLSDEPLGRTRTTCIALAMGILIFLQGKPKHGHLLIV